MAAVVSLGSINADFVVRTDRSPDGPGTMLAAELLRTSGGKAGNVAVLAARLGVDALLLGCVGDDDLANQALRGPAEAGLDLRGVRRRPVSTGYASIAVPPDGAKTILLVPGANDAWTEDADAVVEDLRRVSAGSALVTDLEVPPAVVRAGLRVARERGFPTVLDPSPTARLDDEMLRFVDHLTPDHAEAAALTGIGATDEAGAVAAAEQLRGRGAAVVHVKLEHGGCVTASDAGNIVVESPDVEAVDATGAGDAFAGALAVALLERASLPAAVGMAVAASTCAVTGYGSQEPYPTRAQLDAIARRVRSRSPQPRP